MDINQIISSASKPHMDGINAALAALKAAAEGAQAAGFKVSLLPEAGQKDGDIPFFLNAVSGLVLRDEVNVELTYSVSVISKDPAPAAPQANPAA